MEVSEARGTFDTLRKRLDNSDSRKADKTEVNNLQNQINSLASGSPLVATSIDEMTDTSKVYVNTTDGHWYTHNGTTWVDGGVYQASEDSETVKKLVEDKEDKINISNELSSDLSANSEFFDFIVKIGHTYRIYNTSIQDDSTFSVNLRTKNPSAFVTGIVSNLKSQTYVEFTSEYEGDILHITTSDYTGVSFKIIDLETISKKLEMNVNKLNNFSLNNLTDLGKTFFNNYNFKKYNLLLGHVAYVSNNKVLIEKTDNMYVFTVKVPLSDFNNNINVLLSSKMFNVPIYRLYAVKEDTTFIMINDWTKINTDDFLIINDESLGYYKENNYTYLILSIANTVGGTVINPYKLPDFDFYIYQYIDKINRQIIVDANGKGDYTTIQEAIDNANVWDTILIMPRNLC